MVVSVTEATASPRKLTSQSLLCEIPDGAKAIACTRFGRRDIIERKDTINVFIRIQPDIQLNMVVG
jgi:hypothetical protein